MADHLTVGTKIVDAAHWEFNNQWRKTRELWFALAIEIRFH